jgi:dihydroorotate dehydrogenase electron transfer subunit
MPVPVDIDAEVLRNTRLSDDYNVLVLAAPAVAAAALPGQFVMMRTATGTDPLLRRPYSLFEVLRDGHGQAFALSLLVKRVGPGSTRLFDAAVGDRFGCLGPLGRPFTLADAPTEAWMVAGGVGLAPFATLTEALRARGLAVTLYYGGRTHRDLFYLDWFADRGVRLVLATEDGSRGVHGRVSVPLARDLEAAPADAALMLYACGPEPMLKAVADLAGRSGRPCEVSTERIMGCGLGGCYSCVVRVHDGSSEGHFVRSCIHGPVFNSREIVWE